MLGSWRFSVLVLALLLGGCRGEPGAQGPSGPPGAQGPQGTSALGWTQSGQNVVTTNSGNIGIGTTTPKAKLHVNGSIYIEHDAPLLPSGGCRNVSFDSAQSATDLQELLQPFIDNYGCVFVTLKANTTWTWNKELQTNDFQRLEITGEGFTNVANNLTVTINMTKNKIINNGDGDVRDPTRLLVGFAGQFVLRGVNLVESAMDAHPLTPVPKGALFVATFTRQHCSITLEQIRILTSEDVVSIGNRAEANVNFGHTFINKAAGSPRDILAVKIYSGDAFGGSYAIAHVSQTTLGPGVTFQQTPKIVYSN